MNIKKLSKLTFLCNILAACFSITLISFNLDISLLAFPISIIFTLFFAYFSLIKLFRDSNLKFISVFREFLQYLPYILLIAFVLRRAGNNGTPFFLDLVSVIFWILTSCLTVFILHYLNPKHIGKLSSEWIKFLENQKKERLTQKSFVKTTFREICSWIDALIQAVFMVLLLNIFIVQLYEIPSESMVPEFLIKDRVVVFKTLSGPKFPLSDVGLPYIKKYNRGDIVVFRNPHYSNDRKSEVKTFISQLVYMCTLTKVNLNVDEYGLQKADPLVKRVCGIEGEQLMMQDGILYSRTKDSKDFKPVELDSTWATWNLNAVKPSLKNGIRDFPLNDEDYKNMLLTEESRNNLNISKVSEECKQIAVKFEQNYKKLLNSRKGRISFTDDQMNAASIYVNSGYFTSALLSAENGSEWFTGFMTDWSRNSPDFNGDLYSKANYNLNLMIKLALGKIILRNAELYVSGLSYDSLSSDSLRNSYIAEARNLITYCMLLDQRNMPVFPANSEDGSPRYIPQNCYFMMGDNRFNSLDMRHSYERWTVKLTSADKYSVTYETNMSPQYVNRSRMLGTTSYRFWPVSRAGIPGHTGK